MMRPLAPSLRRALILTSFAGVLAASAGRGAPPRGPGKVRVYYYGLFVNTTSPISEGSIEDRYDLSSLVWRAVPRVLEILGKEELPAFEEHSRNVRLKIVRPGKPPVVLEFGGNVYGLGKPHRISPQSQREVRKLLFAEFPEDWRGG